MARLVEIENMLPTLFKNNETLSQKITYNIEGDAGIGKTEMVEQVANKLGYRFIKVNLAQTEEVGDILGVPVKEFKFVSEKGAIWVQDKNYDAALNAGYKATNECRMGYAVPSWVPKDNTPTIIVFDDYNRAIPMIMQAVMEIISRHEYISWTLPKNTQLLLTSNPEDGDYNVTVQDIAQKSRFITLRAEFNVEDWAKWAESKDLKGELITFALFYKEIFNKESINARNYTMFCNSIKNLDFNKDYLTIETLANGAFSYDKKDTYISTMLQSFVRTKMHCLITPKEMLELPWEVCKEKLIASIYPETEFRPDIASILTTRFMNYIVRFFTEESTAKNKSDIVNNRILELIKSDITVVTEDLIFVILKDLVAKFRVRCSKLLADPVVMTKLL